MKLTQIFDYLKKQNKNFYLVVLGVFGLVLILLSDVNIKTDSSQDSDISFTEQTSQNLISILEKMDGVGRVEVLITLQKSSENQYVFEEKKVTNSTGSTAEQKFVFVDTKDGKSALISATYEPEIQGVLIVCDGADDPNTYNEVLNAVTTLLNISSGKIHITKRK